MEDNKIQDLRQWFKSQGCLIHPDIEVPSTIKGVQGVSARANLPHRTLIIAIPSKLIMTTERCYNDPKLKRLFAKNDDLFDYQSSEDAQFSVLCVFLMYHMLHLEESPWREYLQCVAEPQTAIDWKGHQLKGLNRSVVEQICHVKKECDNLEQELISYLQSRKEFKEASREQLERLFNYCYRVVMTRSFGYYFSQSSLIPIADLFNHKCQVVNHQLLNVAFQKKEQEQQGYQLRSEKIDCSLLSLDPPKEKKLPFRERFLLQKGMIDNNYPIHQLDRSKIDSFVENWNKNILEEGKTAEDLQFCQQDDSEDNDTDEQTTFDKSKQLEMCRQNEEQQMQEFMKHQVEVRKYEQVEQQLAKMDEDKGVKKEHFKQSKEQNKSSEPSDDQDSEGSEQSQKSQSNEDETQQKRAQSESRQQQLKQTSQDEPQQLQSEQEKSEPKKEEATEPQETNPFSHEAMKGVPIQLMDSDDDDDDEDQSEWGLEQGSYFTLSTSSAVKAGSEIYNSYGSRTNRFLLIWYGFCYRDNLYDSVSFRLQVQFGAKPRPATEVVLDSYVGNQGRSFRKPNSQLVKDSQISSEFRLKRNTINHKLLYFLRLYVLNYYKEEDLYKILVTFPASIEFELKVFAYYRQLVEALYERYPAQAIKELKKDMDSEEHRSIRHKINYKIIYLSEQRSILDRQIEGLDALIDILRQCQKNDDRLASSMYSKLPIQTVRFLKDYLASLHKYHYYIEYSQPAHPEEHTQPSTEPHTPSTHSEA